MGFSSGDDNFNKREKVVEVDESRREARERDMQNNGVELEVEFWPVEHPLEPQDEDRPVKCPISAASSSSISESRKHEERLGKRAEVVVAYTEVKKEGIVMALRPAVRGVRKRHHQALTQEEDHIHTYHFQPTTTSPSSKCFDTLTSFES